MNRADEENMLLLDLDSFLQGNVGTALDQFIPDSSDVNSLTDSTDIQSPQRKLMSPQESSVDNLAPRDTTSLLEMGQAFPQDSKISSVGNLQSPNHISMDEESLPGSKRNPILHPRYKSNLLSSCSRSESGHHQPLTDEAIKVIADFCQQPGVLTEMIESLHGEIERNCSLITMLRSFFRNHNRSDKVECLAQFTRCQVEKQLNGQAFSTARNLHAELLAMLKPKRTHETSILTENRPERNNVAETDAHLKERQKVTPTQKIERLIEDSIQKPNDSPKSEDTKKSESMQNLRNKNQTRKRTTKLYTCNDCNFKTKHLKNLNGHLVSHHKKELQGLKTYSCRYCEYKCVDKQRLSEHEPIHTGIKKFQCGDCSKAFATKRGLRTHIKFHSNDRPHKCGQCDAAFKVKPKLRDHVKLVHTQKGEKPFQCGYCKHRASLRGNVNQHIKNAHKGRPVLVLTLDNVTGTTAQRASSPVLN